MNRRRLIQVLGGAMTVDLPDRAVGLVILGYPNWWCGAWTQGCRSKTASEMAQKGGFRAFPVCLVVADHSASSGRSRLTRRP